MHKVIDTPWNTEDHVDRLKAAGVQTVIRYFNHRNSSSLPEKRIEKSEADAIAEAGLSLAVVFQQRGGSGGHISDLDAQSGTADAKQALALAGKIGQPDGSAIYFAVDHDYWRTSELNQIKPYFDAVKRQIGTKYKIGVYGSGKVGKTMRDAGYVDYIWLAAATGWSGTGDMLETDGWALFQQWPPLADPLPHDGNVLSAAWPDYGQFTPGSAIRPASETSRAPNTILMEVIAGSGLKLRRGPSTSFVAEKALVKGTIVIALGKKDEWIKVDLQGDGLADGYMHGGYLRVVSGGFPLVPNTDTAPGSVQSMDQAYAIARREMNLGVAEVAGAGNNPRIVMYHNSTGATGGNALDSVAWCSSFVNYCVEQAGMVGTNSQWALNWKNWGEDVSASPREGDIAVFSRGGGGHVGFYLSETATHIKLLGGNQSNQVKISMYPKSNATYKLKSIRRM